MKIIELLNNMATNKPIPDKIRLFGVTFEYNNKKATYLSHYDKFNLLDMNNHLLRNENISLLNEEIEIIEEEKKIPEKLDIKDIYICDDYQQIHINFKSTWNKINEIIDYLNSKGDE